VTDDFDAGSTKFGFTRGMSPRAFHMSQTSSPRKMSGSQV